MVNTPAFGLPYPVGTDLVIAGDDAIQALAQRIEYLLTPAWAYAAAESSPPQIGVGTTAVWATFGAVGSSGQFAFDAAAETLTYTGPTRWFLVQAEAHAATATVAPTGSTVVLYSSAVARHDSNAKLFVTGNVQGFHYTHKISVPIQLSTGQNLKLLMTSASGATDFTAKGLSIVSIGAPQ